MSDIDQVKRLCESYAIEFKDCGGGHIQLSNHGILVNYYPLSKKRTAYCQQTGERIPHCSPYNAIKLVLNGAEPKVGPTLKVKGEPQFSLKPTTTNPAGLKHLYQGDIPPWEDASEEEWEEHPADVLRLKAWRLEQEVISLRAQADEIDEEAA